MGGPQHEADAGPSRSRHGLFDDVLSGKQQLRPFIPRLRSDPAPFHPLARSLDEFRREEGEDREKRLRALWKKIPHPTRAKHAESGANGNERGSGQATQDERFDAAVTKWEPANARMHNITKERAEYLTRIYHDELLKECALENGMDPTVPVSWSDFKAYADYKEAGQPGNFISKFERLISINRAMAYLSRRIRSRRKWSPRSR